MSRSQDSFSKREREKQKQKKKKEKAEKRAQKKDEESSGSLDDMIAYVDEFGNIVDEKPDPKQKTEIKAEDIVLDHTRADEEDEDLVGKVEFYNDEKGYGFINSHSSRDKYFFHNTGLLQPVKEGDKVSFELENGPRGKQAVKVKIVS